MGRLIRALLFGLVGAGIVHVAVVLLVPLYLTILNPPIIGSDRTTP